MKKLILAVFCGLACMSCERFLEVDLPGQEPKLVINSLMDPADTLRVFLSSSRGLLESGNFFEEFDPVKDALVQLKDEKGNIFPLEYIEKSSPFGPEEGFYFLAEPGLVAGKPYEISASADQFTPITSTEVIPAEVSIRSIDLVNLGQINEGNSNDVFEVTVEFEDPPGEDLYELSGKIIGQDIRVVDGDTIFFSYFSDLFPRPVNPVYEKDYLIRPVILFRDLLLDGENSEMVFRIQLPKDYDLEITIRLAHVSESYYRYYDTADLQDYNRGDALAQPVVVFNNIQNGLGIFMARSVDTEVVKLRLED
ncbi:DUF4249 domain-containing protein [Algoriphagus namhaensis]